MPVDNGHLYADYAVSRQQLKNPLRGGVSSPEEGAEGAAQEEQTGHEEAGLQEEAGLKAALEE